MSLNVNKESLLELEENDQERSLLIDYKLLELERKKIANKASSNFLRLRNWWASVLLVCIGLIVVFNITLIVLIGAGVLKFEDKVLIKIVFVSGLGEVWVLAKIIVDFLFKEPPKI